MNKDTNFICAIICSCTGHNILGGCFLLLYIVKTDLGKAFLKGLFKKKPPTQRMNG